MHDLRGLLADPSRLPGLGRDARQRILAEMAALALAILSEPAAPMAEPAPSQPTLSKEGRWLTPDEAAQIASVPRRTIYGWSRRADWRSFTHRLSRKVLRIEESGFRRWLARPR